jgi:hypothetical protein
MLGGVLLYDIDAVPWIEQLVTLKLKLVFGFGYYFGRPGVRANHHHLVIEVLLRGISADAGGGAA